MYLKKINPITCNYRIVSDLKKQNECCLYTSFAVSIMNIFLHAWYFDIDYSTCGGFIFQVYSVVDEMFLAGEIRETSQTKVLKQLLMLSSLEWSDMCCRNVYIVML